MYLSILLMMTAGLCRTTIATETIFIKENIDIAILPPDTVEVYGEYFFIASDSSPITSSLYYLFPLEGPDSYPFFIAAADKRTSNPLNFDQNPQGMLFTFSMANKDTAVIAITYKQKVGQRIGRYMMLTTSSWGRSLDISKYTVIVPTGYSLSSLSYRYDFVSSNAKEKSYHFIRKPFKIDPDVIFTWRPTAVRSQALKPDRRSR